jgi:LacI family transcriptional regulator, galactose operon repressor
MKKRLKVALLIESSNAYARGLLQGVIDYMQEHQAWSIYIPEQGRGDSPPSWLKNWNGDGIIARIENQEIADALKQTDVPVVDVSAARLIPELPWVETDDKKIAELAAEHLLKRGFQTLAFCGNSQFNWSHWRQKYFKAIVLKKKLNYFEYVVTGKKQSWEAEQEYLSEWVQNLPKPVGVLACYDVLAQKLLDACRASDISVPEEVAVIGVDNDKILCKLSEPSLSSIIPNAHLTGYEAARILSSMMDGKKVNNNPCLVKPIGITTRQSTDIYAIDDRHVADALSFIRLHACDGINVKDVLDQIPLSRRALENRFQKIIGQTPHQEISKIKLEKVKDLLLKTRLTLKEISRRTGFKHVEYMTVAFKKAYRVSPRDYRKSHSYS